MGEFKKKIIDILFEDDTDENESESLDVKKESTKKSAVKATDILYGNQEAPSIMEFLSNETKTEVKEKPEQNEPENKEEYTAIKNVSPIFGSMEEEPHTKVEKPKEEKPIENPKFYGFGDFTGVVISPIFGFDSVRANEARKTMDIDSLSDNNVSSSDDEEPFEEEIKEADEVYEEENVMSFEPREHDDTEELSFNLDDNNQENDEKETEEYQIEEDLKDETEEELTSDDDLLLDSTYDFGDLTESDEEKDLFDELIGDDD